MYVLLVMQVISYKTDVTITCVIFRCVSRIGVRKFVVIHTSKLQPVFIWREKPVLLALLSNLT